MIKEVATVTVARQDASVIVPFQTCLPPPPPRTTKLHASASTPFRVPTAQASARGAGTGGRGQWLGRRRQEGAGAALEERT